MAHTHPDLSDCFLTDEEMTRHMEESQERKLPPSNKEPVFRASFYLNDLHEIRQLDGGSGATVLLFLALHHQTKLTRHPVVTVNGRVADIFCLSRASISRSTQVLEQAGFVEIVSREPGCMTQLSLVPREIRLGRREGREKRDLQTPHRP
jgi:hypothetical protein